MDAEKLAANARAQAELDSGGRLARWMVAKLEMAHVAWWLDQQDESVRAKAADTACEAMSMLRTYL